MWSAHKLNDMVQRCDYNNECAYVRWIPKIKWIFAEKSQRMSLLSNYFINYHQTYNITTYIPKSYSKKYLKNEESLSRFFTETRLTARNRAHGHRLPTSEVFSRNLCQYGEKSWEPEANLKWPKKHFGQKCREKHFWSHRD